MSKDYDNQKYKYYSKKEYGGKYSSQYSKLDTNKGESKWSQLVEQSKKYNSGSISHDNKDIDHHFTDVDTRNKTVDKSHYKIIDKTLDKTDDNTVDEHIDDSKSDKSQSISQNIDARIHKPIKGLDGLRSLAIIGVMLYHMSFSWAKGGLIGVTIFFVLSGYLITSIIVNEIDNTGSFDIKRFWVRRIRRLFPAVVVVILLCLIIFAFCNRVLLTKMRPDVIPSLFWVQNWWYIFRGLSYFDNLGDPSPIIHFWSLSIEEQFYLIWPICILVMKKINCSNKSIAIICAVLALISASAMFLMYNPDMDPTRVYYGTDTRAFSLLIGSFFALVYPWQKRKEDNSFPIILANKYVSFPKIIEIAGTICVAAIVLIMVFVDGLSPFMYYGGLFVVSLLSGVLIVCIVFPETKFKIIFDNRVMSWIGKRSYGIYLWHFPLILLLKPFANDTSSLLFISVLVFFLSFAIAGVQYRFVEVPCRRGAIGKAISRCKIDLKFKKTATISVASSLIVCCVAIGVIFSLPSESIIPEDAIGDAVQDNSVAQFETLQLRQSKGELFYPVIIGDSVTSGVEFENALKEKYGNYLNDSAVGRHSSSVSSILSDYIGRGVVGNTVVISCFSNHIINDSDLDNILNAAGEVRQIILVTCHTPYPLTEENNQKIWAFADAHSENVHVADWFSLAKSNQSYLYNDSTHLTATGSIEYANLLENTINQSLNVNDDSD